MSLHSFRQRKPTTTMKKDSADGILQYIEIQKQAEGLLGERAFALLRSFGKLMGGPQSGLYVSGLPATGQLMLVQRLLAGDTVEVHLMHRHRSGNYESSSLRWTHGRQCPKMSHSSQSTQASWEERRASSALAFRSQMFWLRSTRASDLPG